MEYVFCYLHSCRPNAYVAKYAHWLVNEWSMCFIIYIDIEPMQMWLNMHIDCTETAVFLPILYMLCALYIVDVRTDFGCAVRSCSTHHCQCSWCTSLCAHSAASLCALTLSHTIVCNLLISSSVWHKSYVWHKS